MVEKVAAERRLERKKNISATLTATEKQSRQFRSPCNCSCSVYFLLRAPPKKTLYPPLEGNCYLRMVNLVIITRRLISPRFFHHHWYLPLCCLVVYRVMQAFVETLCIQFLFFYIFYSIHMWICAPVLCTLLINFRVFGSNSAKNVDRLFDLYLFRAVSDLFRIEVASVDFFRSESPIVSNSICRSSITKHFILYDYLFYQRK